MGFPPWSQASFEKKSMPVLAPEALVIAPVEKPSPISLSKKAHRKVSPKATRRTARAWRTGPLLTSWLSA